MNTNWKAQWIWSSKAEGKNNRYVEFRRTLTLNDEIQEPLQLHISARNEYLLYVNGIPVGKGPSPCDAKWQYYDTYDLTGRLQRGENVVAAVCYHFGAAEIVTGQLQGPAGFLLQLEAGDQVLLATDPQWKCRQSPRWSFETERISLWGGYREIYIAQREDGWEAAGYRDDEWETPVVKAEAEDPQGLWPRLLPREIPFLDQKPAAPECVVRIEPNYGRIEREQAVLETVPGAACASPMRVEASTPGAMPSIVLDYGAVVVGTPVVELDAPEGGVLRIAYGESLELAYVDTFILKKGRQRLSPFGRRSGRYVQLTFMAAPAPIEVSCAGFIRSGYLFQQQGRFAARDEKLARIWEISQYTTRMNCHDHPEDCPWRERALWVVDAIVMGKIIYTTFGDTTLMRKSLLQGARIQNADGSIPGTGPEGNAFLLPDFVAYWLLGVMDYYAYTGDQATLLELWPAMKRVASWFGEQVDESGLFAGANRKGWWCFIDWTDVIDKRDKVAAISFLYYKVLGIMAELVQTTGESPEVAATYREQAQELLAAIRTRLWVPERGMFADCIAGSERSERFTLQTNFLAIWCGVMTCEEAAFFIDRIYMEQSLPPVRGPFFQHIVLEVLLERERTGQAVSLIRDYWGAMVERGATTWWETFDATTPFCTIPSTYQGNTPTYLIEKPPVSLCHGWGASPAYLLIRAVLGVDISRLGDRQVHIRMPYSPVGAAEGEIPTRFGPIRVNWSSDEQGTVRGILTAPEELNLVLPERYPLQVVCERSRPADSDLTAIGSVE